MFKSACIWHVHLSFWFRSGFCENNHGESAARCKLKTLAKLTRKTVSSVWSGLCELTNQSRLGFNGRGAFRRTRLKWSVSDSGCSSSWQYEKNCVLLNIKTCKNILVDIYNKSKCTLCFGGLQLFTVVCFFFCIAKSRKERSFSFFLVLVITRIFIKGGTP